MLLVTTYFISFADYLALYSFAVFKYYKIPLQERAVIIKALPADSSSLNMQKLTLLV